jgi:hypothetical protein
MKLFLLGPVVASFCIAGETAAAVSTPDAPGIRYHWEWAKWGAKGGSYWINNSIWNVGSLVMGKDYAQSVNVDPKTFPNGISLVWNYPHPADYRIFSFPEIVFGQSPGKTGAYIPNEFGLVTPPLKKVNQFHEISASYDIALSGDSFAKKHNNIAFDLWLTPGTSYSLADRKFEVFIGVHLRDSCQGKFSYHLTVPSFSADVSLFAHPTWTEICLDPGRDVFSGTIVISDILKDLVKHGIISGEEYIGGVEFGVEPGGGIGTVTIKKFEILWD